MKKRLFESSETQAIIKGILLLTLIFGFNDGTKEFIFTNWLINLFFVFLIVSLISLVFIVGMKLAANYYGTEIKIKVWNSQKFKEAKTLAKKTLLVYSTPILNILVMFLTNGKFYLANILTFDVKKEVLGKKFPYLSHLNISLIVFFGLIFNLVLMWIFKLVELDLGLKISFWFILFNLIPISELPGAKLIAGNVTFYIFCLVFFIVNAVLLKSINSFGALLVSLVFSVLLSTIYFYFYTYKKA